MFRIPGDGQTEDALLQLAADVGAEDVQAVGDAFELVADPKSFAGIREALQERSVAVEAAEIVYRPRNTVGVTGADVARQILAALEELEGSEDIQNTYSNFEMSDELLQELSGESS